MTLAALAANGARQEARKGGGDANEYPEFARPTVSLFHELYFIPPPPKGSGRKPNSEYLYWVNAASDVNEACGEFGLGLMRLHAERYWKAAKDDPLGKPPYDINSPRSIVRTLTGLAGQVRAGVIHLNGQGQQPEYTGGGIYV